MADTPLVPIGTLAERTGVAASALRYYEERGLLRPAVRVAGRRQYAPSAERVVGTILLLRDLGFRLDEIRGLMRTRGESPSAWRDVTARKVAEIDERILALRSAREALVHSLDECAADDIATCPIFQSVVDERLTGVRPADLGAHAEPSPSPTRPG